MKIDAAVTVWSGQIRSFRQDAGALRFLALIRYCASRMIFIKPVSLKCESAFCPQVSAEMYSAPSIVLQSRGPDGSVHVFDDFRESYAWLRQNTKEDAKVRIILLLKF